MLEDVRPQVSSIAKWMTKEIAPTTWCVFARLQVEGFEEELWLDPWLLRQPREVIEKVIIEEIEARKRNEVVKGEDRGAADGE